VLVASHGDHDLLRLDGRDAWHFPRAEDGNYAGGAPADSEEAMQHLESQSGGGSYFLLPAHSSWWRDHYRSFFVWLDEEARVVWEDDSCLIYRHEAQVGEVTGLAAIDSSSFCARGWLRNPPPLRLTAVSPGGERIELLERLFSNQHPDLAGLACDATPSYIGDWSDFIVYWETDGPDAPPGKWSFELEADLIGTVELPAASPVPVREIDAVRKLILDGLRADSDERLMSEHVHPVISQLQERARSLVRVAGSSIHGEQVKSPEVSIVVPVYAGVDLIEHQIAQFVHDPEIRDAELIYVLDSPELAEWREEGASGLYDLYGLPFKVLAMGRASGFAAATNAGAAEAQGRLLLLMNSDVLPDRPGWLGKLKSFYDATERIGALGAKLVYEDESLQHAGMYFERLEEGGSWVNRHYFKGFGRHFPAADVARPVPAVTGACLIIDRRLFLDTGGLTDAYVQGDFEDSDLCLRLLQAGRENWYLPDAELYHVEGQSYDSESRAKQWIYNRWLHTRRCRELIEATVTRYPSPSSV
jgi:GT2 family glycosyltransferase